MKRTKSITRLERLDFLTARLKSDEALTVGGLAEEMGVSVRTITRDIQILRERGLPVEADRGRGGGVRLHWRWGIGRLELSYSEAIDLLVSLAVAEQMKSPLLMANLASIRHKLMASFSPSLKHKIGQLKSRILIGGSASSFMLSSFVAPNPKVVERLHQAFLLLQMLRIQYRKQGGEVSERVIEPHYLLLNYPIWYVLAWDHLRSEIRTFRCDRFEQTSLLEDPFTLKPLSLFERSIDGDNTIRP